MRRSRSIVLSALALSIVAMPAIADPNRGPLDLSTLPGGTPSAETGKPAIGVPPPPGPRLDTGCHPALPCDTRLLGTVRKNGAVELQVPAWRW